MSFSVLYFYPKTLSMKRLQRIQGKTLMPRVSTMVSAFNKSQAYLKLMEKLSENRKAAYEPIPMLKNSEAGLYLGMHSSGDFPEDLVISAYEANKLFRTKHELQIDSFEDSSHYSAHYFKPIYAVEDNYDQSLCLLAR